MQIVGLLVDHSLEALTAAVEASLESDAPGIGSIRQLLRHQTQPRVAIEPVDLTRVDLAQIDVAPAELAMYGSLLGQVSGGVHA